MRVPRGCPIISGISYWLALLLFVYVRAGVCVRAYARERVRVCVRVRACACGYQYLGRPVFELCRFTWFWSLAGFDIWPRFRFCVFVWFFVFDFFTWLSSSGPKCRFLYFFVGFCIWYWNKNYIWISITLKTIWWKKNYLSTLLFLQLLIL